MGIRYTVGGKMKAILDPQVHPRGQLCGAPQGPVLTLRDLAGIDVPWYLWSRSLVRSRALLMALLRGSEMGNLVIRFLKKPLGRCQSHALAFRYWC